MPYTIEYLKDEGIVEILAVGKLTIEDYIKLIEDAVEVLLKKNTRLLYFDTSDLSASIKPTEILSIPELWEGIGVSRTNKLAVLIPKDEALHEDIRFFENVSRNRGWQVKLFDKKDDAFKWLLKF